MRLGDDLLEKLTGAHLRMDFDRDAGFFSLLERTVEVVVAGAGDVGEAQLPPVIALHRLHESVGDADGNVKVGDRVFIGLAGDEFLDIGVIDAQDSHIGAAARTTLGNLAKGLIVNAQETHGTGSLPGGRHDHSILGAQT
jgi:hypothetical protein